MSQLLLHGSIPHHVHVAILDQLKALDEDTWASEHLRCDIASSLVKRDITHIEYVHIFVVEENEKFVVSGAHGGVAATRVDDFRHVRYEDFFD